MRVYRASYKDRSGKTRKAEKWYAEFWDPRKRKPRRIPAFANKGASLEFCRKLSRLQGYRASNATPDAELREWLRTLPDELTRKLVELDLLDRATIAGNGVLKHQVEEFRNHLTGKGRSPRHIKWTCSQVTKIIEACAFLSWSDVRRERVEHFLADLRDGSAAVKTRSANGYLTALKSFANWAIQADRIHYSPVAGIKNFCITDQRETRALTLDELRWLLPIVADEPERFGMSGEERALLYRLAVETGLRAGELTSLTVASFNLSADAPAVAITAGSAKNRKEDSIDLTPSTAGLLSKHFQRKMAGAKAFNLPASTHTAEMFRQDLAAGRKAWIDAADSKADKQKREDGSFLSVIDGANRVLVFHSTRHTRGVWLFDHHKATAREVQALMRVSTIKLVDRYTRSFRVQGQSIAARAPDLTSVRKPIAKAE